MEKTKIFELLKEKIQTIKCSHPIRIGIDGVDAAGKTIFADDFAKFLQKTGKQIIRASIDGFHNPKEIRYQKGQDSPEGYYFDSFNNQAIIDLLLKPIGPNGSLKFRKSIFNYMNNSEVESPIDVAQEDAILIFDGIFLFRPDLVEYWDLKIFLDVQFDITIQRTLKRIKDKKYLGSEQDILSKYKKRYIPGQKIYITNVNPKEKADIVIENIDFNNPILIK